MIYLVVGVPGSGKSLVCENLLRIVGDGKIDYVHHDLYIGMGGSAYVKEILKHRKHTPTALTLTEAPFSVSLIRDPLLEAGEEVETFYIVEPEQIVSDRYLLRESKSIPRGHLTRQNTYWRRAHEEGAFVGTSNEVLKHLLGKF